MLVEASFDYDANDEDQIRGSASAGNYSSFDASSLSKRRRGAIEAGTLGGVGMHPRHMRHRDNRHHRRGRGGTGNGVGGGAGVASGGSTGGVGDAGGNGHHRRRLRSRLRPSHHNGRGWNRESLSPPVGADDYYLYTNGGAGGGGGGGGRYPSTASEDLTPPPPAQDGRTYVEYVVMSHDKAASGAGNHHNNHHGNRNHHRRHRHHRRPQDDDSYASNNVANLVYVNQEIVVATSGASQGFGSESSPEPSQSTACSTAVEAAAAAGASTPVIVFEDKPCEETTEASRADSTTPEPAERKGRRIIFADELGKPLEEVKLITPRKPRRQKFFGVRNANNTHGGMRRGGLPANNGSGVGTGSIYGNLNGGDLRREPFAPITNRSLDDSSLNSTLDDSFGDDRNETVGVARGGRHAAMQQALVAALGGHGPPMPNPFVHRRGSMHQRELFLLQEQRRHHLAREQAAATAAAAAAVAAGNGVGNAGAVAGRRGMIAGGHGRGGRGRSMHRF